MGKKYKINKHLEHINLNKINSMSMKNRLIFLILFLIGNSIYSQVGIGKLDPSSSSQLEVFAADKGILIPRVSLTGTTDQATITNGNVNSLLVFNTALIADVKPGYYYWYIDRWQKIANSDEIISSSSGEGSGVPGKQGEPGYPGKDVLIYHDVITNEVYVQNTDGTWTKISGEKGEKGDKGNVGLAEGTGAPGNKEQAGYPGEDISIYKDNATDEIYVQNIDGTWTKINGKDGQLVVVDGTGTPGNKGEAGYPGSNVNIYTNNATGEVYVQNADGIWIRISGKNGKDGKDFTYSDFTPDQLEGLKGKPGIDGKDFTYSDFTPDQLASLKGETGPQGSMGLQGVPGPAGLQGSIGLTGDTGPQGPAGSTGAAGAQGPIGLTGATGPQGPIGLTGDIGPQGLAGVAGPQGTSGPQGVAGPTGPQGIAGPTGAQGIAGPAGPQGVAGPVGEAGPQGPTGLTGPAGPQGSAGLAGSQGPVGPQGVAGPTGSQGPIGLTGATGPQGPTGLTGSTGAQGPAGSTGPQGPVGLQGVAGPTGPQGPIGLTGDVGPQGPTGPTGAMGPQGPIGLTGPTGPQGAQGPKGDTGAAGTQGIPGIQGLKGDKGADGIQGPAGVQGVAGVPGEKGADGAVGPIGPKGDPGDPATVTKTNLKIEAGTPMSIAGTGKIVDADLTLKITPGTAGQVLTTNVLNAVVWAPPVVDGTEWNISGTSTDALSNKINEITRSGNIRIGSDNGGSVAVGNNADAGYVNIYDQQGTKQVMINYHNPSKTFYLQNLAGDISIGQSGYNKVGIGTGIPVSKLFVESGAIGVSSNLTDVYPQLNSGTGGFFLGWASSNLSAGSGTSELVNYKGTSGALTNAFSFYNTPDAAKVNSGHLIASISSTGVYTALSDQRVKTEIKNIPYGLAEVLKMQPKMYNLHAVKSMANGRVELGETTGKNDLGLLAQELYKIIPEAVNKPQDENKDLYGVKYTELIPVLINAIKEQQAQLEDLKNQIEILKVK